MKSITVLFIFPGIKFTNIALVRKMNLKLMRLLPNTLNNYQILAKVKYIEI